MSLIKITKKRRKDDNQRNVLFPLDNRHFITDIGYTVDVVVFLVNKTIGMTYIRDMRELGIKYAWMQPGTYDEDLLHAFHDQGIETIENCVLQVMNS